MKKILLLLSIFYILIGNFVTYAETGKINEDKSIKEIKKDIEKLHLDRNTINNELVILTKNNNFILFLVKNGYFRDNITKEELSDIEFLVTTYNKSIEDINNKLLDKSKNLEDISDDKKSLLNLKKELYQDFIPYVSQDKYLDYLDFIKGDALIVKRENDIKYNLVKNKEILNNKVSKIEEKIVIERKKMSDQLKLKVGLKIDEKISKISTDEKYLSLTPELKEKVIQKTIIKVQEKIKQTKLQENSDNILFQKIEIYELLEYKLQIFYNNLIEENKKEG